MHRLALILIFFYSSCNNPEPSSTTNESAPRVENTKNDPVEGATRTFLDSTTSKAYCYFTPVSDSACNILIGNGDAQRSEVFDINPWIVENKMNYSWHNQNFISLGWSAGSGIGFDLVLPINNDIPFQVYSNVLTENIAKSLIVIEGFGDTACIIVNLQSQKEQAILIGEPCISAIQHSCISKVIIDQDSLTFIWDAGKTGEGVKVKKAVII